MRVINKWRTIVLIASLCLVLYVDAYAHSGEPKWQLIDNFEDTNKAELSTNWFVVDTQNETSPFIANPQVAQINHDTLKGNIYYLKKAAPDGVRGNRKALSYIALPSPVPVGEIYTFYTRIMVEKFPNNHSFGLSNLSSNDIDKESYNAFEPMLRVTDKAESNGFKNTGALMAIVDSPNGKAVYQDVFNLLSSASAKPLQAGTWYQIWYVVNNATAADGGQTYQIHMQGGEFEQQTAVFGNGKFRMAREQALTHFITIANTGSHKKPYGNGGLAYDDIYMVQGTNLSKPPKR